MGPVWSESLSFRDRFRHITQHLLQDVQLHIGDPKPLYNILIKDHDIFEETDSIIEYVNISRDFFSTAMRRLMLFT